MERAERRRVYNDGRAAMLTNDEANMPRQHAGPVRRYIRDYVDSRRRLSELALPAVILLLVLQAVRMYYATLAMYGLWAVMLIGVAIEWSLLLRGVRRGLRERFPEDSIAGYRIYTIGRAIQMRRLRLPKPRLKRGQAF
jgi:hypothetical protein